MLSDEEKKVVEWLKQSINEYNDIFQGKIEDESGIKRMKTIKNLIEKQSKEIEELNKENTRQHELIGNIHKKWEDKIKAKTIEIKNRPVKDEFITASQGKLNTIIDMESLL